MDHTLSPATAGQHAHVVQLYTDTPSLLDTLGRFVGGSVAVGDAAVVIATREHHEGLKQRLLQRGLDIQKSIREGRCVLADAQETLDSLLVAGKLDGDRFRATIGNLLTRVRQAAGSSHSPIAVFGEMVALLWADGMQEEALRLEELWNDLATEHSFSLLCAYPMNVFGSDSQMAPFLRMCALHSGVVPHEAPLALGRAEQRLQTIADLQQKTQALENALKLRRSEERFRLFVEAVRDYAIFMLDAEGHIASWNAGAQRLKGYLGAEIIGKHFSCFYLEADRRRGKPQWELEVAAAEGRIEDEGWRIRKDGSRFWANVIITAIRDESGKLIGFGKVTRDVTEKMLTERALQQEVAERRETEKRLQQSEVSLRQLSLHLLRSQDEERRRIGRELHDSLGQSLVGTKITLDTASNLLKPEDEDLRRLITEATDLVQESLREVRTISYLLYPPMLEETGLRSAVAWYVEGFSARSGIQVTLHADEAFGRLRPETELALFRVLQESLTNIHRHSGSSKADIRLLRENGSFIMEVRDHGAGTSVAQRTDGQRSNGVGLRGMQERVHELGGKFEFISTESGTTVRAIVPAAEGRLNLVKTD